MRLENATPNALRNLEAELSRQYDAFKAESLNLDLTRGKPSADQLDLANPLDGILDGRYVDSTGTDLRNYGGLDGIPEAKTLFAPVLNVREDEILIGGNSSLTLMYMSALFAYHYGLDGKDSAWAANGAPVRFLCPVPGYDRHFSVCQHIGIEMIPVPMNDEGPIMDEVEALVKKDPTIKGMWCVPRFSNPSGIVYSDDVVDRIARLGKIAGPNFRVFWDNAYAIHTLQPDAPELASVMDLCRKHGTEDSVLIFGSTSKISFAGAGVAFMGASAKNLARLRAHFGMTMIGPDKINQSRHVAFFKTFDGLLAHMQKHADLLKPRFDAVLKRLDAAFGDSDMGSWTVPQGGYFISFDTRPGLAKKVVALANDVGVKLTPAGATFPLGQDPNDCNIRIAPSFPTVATIEKATDVFCVCVQLASVRQALEN